MIKPETEFVRTEDSVLRSVVVIPQSCIYPRYRDDESKDRDRRGSTGSDHGFEEWIALKFAGCRTMLTRIEIKNFRSCQDVRIDVSGALLCLIGRNGAGKTNVLRAIEWAARCATSTVSWNWDTALSAVQLPSVTIAFKLTETAYRYVISPQLERVPGIPPGRKSFSIVFAETLEIQGEMVLERRDDAVKLRNRVEPLKIGRQTSALAAILSLLPAEDESTVMARPVFTYLSALRYYSLDESDASSQEEQYSDFGHLISAESYAKWLSLYRSTGDAGSSVLMRLIYVAQEDVETLNVLRSMLGADGLGLIDTVLHRSVNLPRGADGGSTPLGDTLHFLHFRPSDARQAFLCYYGQLSLGTRRVLRILTYFLFDHATVMLIEQPEDGLHQGLTKKLIATLKANAEATQLVISSHSSALLNTLTPEEVRLVIMKDGVTSVRPLTANELTAAADFMNKEGSLSDFIETVGEE